MPLSGTDTTSDQPVGLDRRTALFAAGKACALAVMPFGGMALAQEGESSQAKPLPATRLVKGQSLTATVAQYAAATSIEAIPAEVKDRARMVIFDEMACSYFGRPSPGGAAAARYVESCASGTEAPIYGTALRASAPFAAMANGSAGHGDEVDGTHVVGGHPGSSIVHAATAIAAKQNASGAELLNAVVLGYDIGVRMVEACGGKFRVKDSKHLTSDFLYALGATAAAARILRLEPLLHCHALALVTFQANGLNALYSEKHHVSKSFCNGQYAFAGVSSAQMVQHGLEGNEDIIGSQDGLLDAWGDGAHDQAVVSDLGKTFKIMRANFKFYNAGYPIHTPLEAALTLVKRHGIANDQIRSILIGMPLNALKVVDNRKMHNICVQDMVAANLTAGGLALAAQPFPAMLDDPVYRRLRGLITAAVDPELQQANPNGRGARVTITTLDGKRVSLRIDAPRGHSTRGATSWTELAEKWRASLPNLDPARAMELATRLETLPNANTLFAAFAGKV